MHYDLIKCILLLYVFFFYNSFMKKGVILVSHFTGDEETEGQKNDLPKVTQLVSGGD